MKKNLLLPLGTIFVLSAPIVAAVSCSTDTTPEVTIDPVYGVYGDDQDIIRMNPNPEDWKDGEPRWILEDGLKRQNPNFIIDIPTPPAPTLIRPQDFWDNVQDADGDWKFLVDQLGNKLPNPNYDVISIDSLELDILSDFGLSQGNGILASPRTLPINFNFAPAGDQKMSEETVYKWATSAPITSIDELRRWMIANETESAIRRQFNLIGPNENTLLVPRNTPLPPSATHVESIVYKWYRRSSQPGMPPVGPEGLPVSIYDVRKYIDSVVGLTPGGALYLSGPLTPPSTPPSPVLPNTNPQQVVQAPANYARPSLQLPPLPEPVAVPPIVNEQQSPERIK